MCLTLISEYNDNIVKWHYLESDENFEYSGGAGEIDLHSLAPHLSPVLSEDEQTFRRNSSFYIYSFPEIDIGDYYVLVGPIVI